MYNFCRLYTGGSIDGAIKLNHGVADICRALTMPGGIPCRVGYHAVRETGEDVRVRALVPLPVRQHRTELRWTSARLSTGLAGFITQKSRKRRGAASAVISHPCECKHVPCRRA